MFNEAVYSEYDTSILAMAHEAFNYESIKKTTSLLIDTRGTFGNYKNEKIAQA
jgi:UDP-N-acetyl-D-mannosaminuronate dehydrogenase